MVVAVYEADIGKQCRSSVNLPFRPDRAEMVLDRGAENWVYVDPGEMSAIPFGQKTGLYTKGLGHCIAVILLSGRQSRYTGFYTHGALAHLMGGGLEEELAARMVQGMGVAAAQLTARSRLNSWNVHLVIAGGRLTMNDARIAAILAVFRSVSDIPDTSVTVYRGSVAGGFGVTRTGWIGVPQFEVNWMRDS